MPPKPKIKNKKQIKSGNLSPHGLALFSVVSTEGGRGVQSSSILALPPRKLRTKVNLTVFSWHLSAGIRFFLPLAICKFISMDFWPYVFSLLHSQLSVQAWLSTVNGQQLSRPLQDLEQTFCLDHWDLQSPILPLLLISHTPLHSEG